MGGLSLFKSSTRAGVRESSRLWGSEKVGEGLGRAVFENNVSTLLPAEVIVSESSSFVSESTACVTAGIRRVLMGINVIIR